MCHDLLRFSLCSGDLLTFNTTHPLFLLSCFQTRTEEKTTTPSPLRLSSNFVSRMQSFEANIFFSNTRNVGILHSPSPVRGTHVHTSSIFRDFRKVFRILLAKYQRHVHRPLVSLVALIEIYTFMNKTSIFDQYCTSYSRKINSICC